VSYHGIIFTGMTEFRFPAKAIGPYRIRTMAKKYGYRIKVVDNMHVMSQQEIEQILENLVNKDTLFVGSSSTFLDPEPNKMLRNACVTQKRKTPHIKLVLGGARSIYYNKQFGFDWVISGYSDNSIVQLLYLLDGKPNSLVYETQTRQVDSKQEQYHFVDSNKNHGDIDMGELMTEWEASDDIRPHDTLPIEISRGCIFKCSFCYFPLNGKGKFDYFRHQDEIVKELQTNYEQFGVTNYVFLDDTYNDSREKLKFIDEVLAQLNFKIKFSTYIKPELLVAWPESQQQIAEQGLESGAMGVESFHPMARKMIGKGTTIDKINDATANLRRYGNGQLSVAYNMIVGLPHEPISSVMESYEWLKTTDVVDTWNWNALSIQSLKNPNVYSSLIDKSPEAYGYTITGDDGRLRSWTNDHTTWEDAHALMNELKKDSEKYRRLGGWMISVLRNIDYDIESTICKQLSSDTPWHKLRLVGHMRSRDYVINQLKERVE